MSAFPSVVRKADPGPGDELLSAFEWIEGTIRATPFGEVGISFVLHDGKITRVKHLVESSFKVSAAGNRID